MQKRNEPQKFKAMVGGETWRSEKIFPRVPTDNLQYSGRSFPNVARVANHEPVHPATDLPWNRAALTVLIGWGLSLAAWAHDPGLSSASVRISVERVEALITLALQDADELGGLDTNHDGQVSMEEFSAGSEKVGKLVGDAFEVRFDREAGHATNVLCQLDDNNNVEVYLTFPGRNFSTLTLRSKMIAAFRLDHRQYLLLQNPGGDTLAERLLSASSDTMTIEVEPEPLPPPATLVPAQSPAASQNTLSFGSLVKPSARSALTQCDHLLFLLALLIVARSVFSSLKLICLFSVGQSTALALASFNLISIPYEWTGPLIAATLVYIGIENVVRHAEPRGRGVWLPVFGRIYGFGFAFALSQAGLGTKASDLVKRLLAFNLGVELVQLSAWALVVLICFRFWTGPFFIKRVVPTCSIAVALAGALWFVLRVWPK